MASLRPLDSRTLAKVFEQDGFMFNRQHGRPSHYTKPGVKRPLVIPTCREVPVFIIKNLLRTADMSREGSGTYHYRRERSFDLLQNC